jgi:hypothetical protein
VQARTLRFADLSATETKLNDSSLEQLKAFPQLRKLHICETEVTDAGVAELEKTLTNVKVER